MRRGPRKTYRTGREAMRSRLQTVGGPVVEGPPEVLRAHCRAVQVQVGRQAPNRSSRSSPGWSPEPHGFEPGSRPDNSDPERPRRTGTVCKSDSAATDSSKPCHSVTAAAACVFSAKFRKQTISHRRLVSNTFWPFFSESAVEGHEYLFDRSGGPSAGFRVLLSQCDSDPRSSPTEGPVPLAPTGTGNRD